MKTKNLFLLLIMASMFFALGACDFGTVTEDHVHTFDSTWSYDDTVHYHQATCEHTNERSDVATHIWDSGQIQGDVTTYTCTVCGQTKMVIACDITFDENGHGEKPASVYDVQALPLTLPTLSSDNYFFGGWYFDSAFTQPAMAGVSITTDVVLYAKWLDADEVMLEYIDALVSNTFGAVPAWNMESYKGKWNYIDGVFLNAIVNLYYGVKDTDATKAEYYRDFFLDYLDYYLDDDGNFLNLTNSTLPGFTTSELDSICESKILFDAYQFTGDERYLQAIEYTYDTLTSMNTVTGSSNYWHKESYPNQIWLDGMYMYAPFYARYASATGEDSIFAIIKEQYAYIRNHMFDEVKQLYYHGYDATKTVFWADDVTGCSESFWLRSMGWYIVSLVDVLEYFPSGSEKTYLTGLLKEALDGILQYQDPTSKLFYQVIDGINSDFTPKTITVPATYLASLGNTAYQVNGEYVDCNITNYLETSGSAMIAYALMKASNCEYIDSSYYVLGEDIYKGLLKTAFDGTNLTNICITAGLGPDNRTYRDGSMAYYLAEKVGSNDAKGVGPFIMAYLAYTMPNSTALTPNIQTLTIKFTTNGGENIADASVYYNHKLTLPSDPVKEDFIFLGWYTDVDCENAFDSDSLITKDLTLYASWQAEASEYTKVYSVDFEEGSENTLLSTTVSSSPYANSATSSNNVVLTKDGSEAITGQSAKLYDTSATTTILNIPYISNTNDMYRVNLDIRPLKNQVTKWTLVNYDGANVALRVDESGMLCASPDGGTTLLSSTFAYVGNIVYHVETVFDYQTKTFTMTVNGQVLANSVTFSGNALSNLRFITANADTTRSLIVDNVIISKKTTEAPEPIDNECATYSEAAYIIWQEASSTQASAYYKLSSSSEYIKADAQLIRQLSSTNARVDFVGLASGNYDFQVITSTNQTIEYKDVVVGGYDRSGYAFFGKTDGVGAYNNDGTLKENAEVIYITDANKNTVTLGKYQGLGNILAHASAYTNPVCIRIIGQISCATWDAQTVNVYSSKYLTGSYSNADNTKTRDAGLGITFINGIRDSVTGSVGDWDSVFNQAELKNGQNWTIEGIGSDAIIFQWGITIKQSNSVEVRNLTFTDYPEDACAIEGSSGSERNYANYWIHNNVFNQGKNYWDLTQEQDKHEGDGATDFKYASNVTYSYNVYNYCHKTGLIGGSNTNMQCNVTFHHNYFNQCSSRMPLGRQANMHYYNNYSYGITSYCMSLRANAYALSEANYFENCAQTITIDFSSVNSQTSIPAVKSYQDYFSNCNVGAGTVVESRTTTVTNTCTYGTTFDTNSSLFYYDSVNQASDVAYLTSAASAKSDCLQYAGVCKATPSV